MSRPNSSLGGLENHFDFDVVVNMLSLLGKTLSVHEKGMGSGKTTLELEGLEYICLCVDVMAIQHVSIEHSADKRKVSIFFVLSCACFCKKPSF